MKKFTKGVLIAAGCFFAGGVILGSIGAIGRSYTGEQIDSGEEFGMIRDTWSRLMKWDIRRLKEGESGIVAEYGVEYDENHETTYGSFRDDNLRETDVYRLDIEIGGGRLVIKQGNHMELKKDGGPGCQYYIEGDTFYLKQKYVTGGGMADLTLTLPESMNLDEVEIEIGAGEITAEDLLETGKVAITVEAGEITMEEVRTEMFLATVGAGAVTVERLDADDCEVNLGMGSVTLQDSLVKGLDVEVSMGEMEILLRDSYEDHDYIVNCNMGEISIAEGSRIKRKCGGFNNSLEFSGKNASGDSSYRLNCSMGNIYMKFSGTEDGNAADAAEGTEKERQKTGEELQEMEDELQEMSEGMPDLKEIDIDYGIEDNWPESIGHENRNTTAENFSFEIPISEPVKLAVTCVTKSGELDLVIENEEGKEIFKKDNIQTGTYEVNADTAGTYTVYFDCENHTGGFWMKPAE